MYGTAGRVKVERVLFLNASPEEKPAVPRQPRGWNLKESALETVEDDHGYFHHFETRASIIGFPVNRDEKRRIPGLWPGQDFRSVFIFPRILICPAIGNKHNLWLSRFELLDDMDSVYFGVYRQWGPAGVYLKVFT